MLPDFFSQILVRFDSFPSNLDNIVNHGVLWYASPDSFVIEVPNVARYLVEGGNSVTIDVALGAEEEHVVHHLHLLPMAALAYQRGMIAFHAAAVSDGEVALLLAGDSGAGKSTLLAHLLLNGWQMLADDLTIVGLDMEGFPVVYPVCSGIALWQNSMEKLGIRSENNPSCDANRRKYSFPDQFNTIPCRLRSIYRLGIHNARKVEVEEFKGSARFQAIMTMLYNSHVADTLCDRSDYFRCAATIAMSVQIRALRRPRGTWSISELASHILF